MEQSVHRPLSQSGLPIVRRVNSAIGERVGLDLLRGPRRPVVTDSSIDPSTRCHPKIIALRDRAAAARAVGRRSRIPAFLKWPGVGAEGAAPPTREPYGR